MLGKPRILSLFPNSLINSIKHEHSCKILCFHSIKRTGKTVLYKMVNTAKENIWIMQKIQFSYHSLVMPNVKDL